MELRKNRIKQRLRDGKHVIAIENMNDADSVEQFAPNNPHCFWFEGEHFIANPQNIGAVSYTHLRAHETKANLGCRLLR